MESVLVVFGVMFLLFFVLESAIGGHGNKGNQEAVVTAAKETAEAGSFFVKVLLVAAAIFIVVMLASH